MTVIVLGLTRDADAALTLVQALDFAGFGGEELDVTRGLAIQLVARGVPPQEAEAYEEGVRRGGRVVCIRADSENEGEEAIEIMDEHRALGRIYPAS
jgi:hypothetical protein